MENPIWGERLRILKERSLERRILTISGPVGPVVSSKDGPKICFCSNDYLGLAGDSRIVEAMTTAAVKWGVGTAASRLICGNTEIHDQLELEVAQFMGTEEAVLFPSGYQANVGAISALTERGDAIFSDELVHASLVDGARLSRANVRIFDHSNIAHLRERLMLEDTKELKLIVSDSLFSMDGDQALLDDLVELAKEYGAVLFLDEAHALGVVGPCGQGLAAEEGLVDRVPLRIGTFGKAFGVCGAFVACSSTVASILRSRARALLYTTGAPAALAAAALRSLEIVRAADDRRQMLNSNIKLFRELAHEHELPTYESTSAIQPMLIGSAKRTMAASKQLWESGLFVQGIRPPTVKEGTSRLRITLTASHRPEQIEQLVDALVKVVPPPSSTYPPPGFGVRK
jgi:8-amino-7-oxononanoate synthase